MPRVRLPGLVGPSARVRSPKANVERSINWYPERKEQGNPASEVYFLGTPGIQPFIGLPAGAPIRALFYESTYQQCFAVGGRGLYKIFPNHSAQFFGALADDGRPATISSSGVAGHQLFITAGGFGYIFDLNDDSLTLITDDGFNVPTLMGLFTDGYFLSLYVGGFQWSSLEDGLTWDGTDVAQVSQAADTPIAMGLSHREIWLWGTKTTNPWYDAGDGNNPFIPIQGAFIELGIAAPFAFTNLDNTLFWLTENQNGGRQVVRANGYAGQRVSTHAVEYALNQASSMQGATMFAQQDEGHAFVWLIVPTMETTWVYDVSADLWHERALWNTDTMAFEPHPAICHTYAFGTTHLVGDRGAGMVYELSLNLYADDLFLSVS